MLNKTPRVCFDEIDASAVEALLRGRLADPFAFLGPHDTPHGRLIRVFAPGAEGVDVLSCANGGRLGQAWMQFVQDRFFPGPALPIALSPFV